MKLEETVSNTVGLIVGALLLFVVGTYTENGGFQFAGVLMMISAVLSLNAALGKQGTD